MDRYTLISREHLLQNQWYKIYLDKLSVVGKVLEQDYFFIDFFNDSVAVIIENENEEVLFVNAYRYILNKICLEIPAGSVEQGEDISEAGVRECLEETGYSIHLKKEHFDFYASNGVSNQKFHVLFAKVDKNSFQRGIDEEEIQKIEWIDKKKVKSMIASNKFDDGLSLTALLLYFFNEEGIQNEN